VSLFAPHKNWRSRMTPEQPADDQADHQ